MRDVFTSGKLFHPLLVHAQDPNTNKIKQWLAESATDGVITKELELSTLPVMGDWKIKATADVRETNQS